MIRSLFYILITFHTFSNTYGQCPVLDFSLPVDACISEEVIITNSSSGASTYSWDFCSGSIASSDGILEANITTTGVSQPFGFEMVRVGTNLVIFESNRNNDKLVRIDQGNEIDQNYSQSDFDLGGIVNAPMGIKILQEGTNWYGILSGDDGVIYRLVYGGDPLSIPTVDIIGNFGVTLTIGIGVIVDNGNTYAFIAGGGVGQGKIVQLNFGTSIANIPSSIIHDIGGSVPNDISLVNDCGTWYGLISSFSSDLKSIDLSAGLDMPPVIGTIGSFTSQRGVELIKDGDIYYGLVLLNNNTIQRLNLGTDISLFDLSSTTDLGGYGALSSNFAMDISQFDGIYRIVTGGGTNNEVQFVEFEKACVFSDANSKQEDPVGIVYDASGIYDITLTGVSSGGETISLTKQITVTVDVAPDIKIGIDNNRCVSNSNTFTSINSSGNIQTYTWDFGDGSPTSPDPNPTHDYGVTMGCRIVRCRSHSSKYRWLQQLHPTNHRDLRRTYPRLH